MKLFTANSSRLVVAVAVLVAVCATGIAVAASTGSTKIHGCYAKKGGALRVVKAGAACKTGEMAIAWNKRGPRGPRGPAGSARAYAAVNADATLDVAASKNIVRVDDFGTGLYCVILDPSIDLATVAPIVSLRGLSGSTDTAIYAASSGCTSGSDSGVLVSTKDLAGTEKAADFSLLVP
jgi:hypothetical protein